jgi:hypothetical protein
MKFNILLPPLSKLLNGERVWLLLKRLVCLTIWTALIWRWSDMQLLMTRIGASTYAGRVIFLNR